MNIFLLYGLLGLTFSLWLGVVQTLVVEKEKQASVPMLLFCGLVWPLSLVLIVYYVVKTLREESTNEK